MARSTRHQAQRPARRLTLRELNRATLARQGLLDALEPMPAADTVRRLGSLQAQHPDWPPFALASRQRRDPPWTDLDAARRDRTVVRSSLMRLTAHIVAAADFWPAVAVSLPHRQAQWRTLFRQDPRTSPLARRIAAAHPAVLDAMRGEPLAIHQVERVLGEQLPGVEIPPNRCLWRHFSAFVPLIHVPYPDERYGRSRYLPAETWLPGGRPIDDLEAAAVVVAERYLAAFGPATVEDLAAFVGRGRDLPRWRRAVAALDDRLVTLQDEEGRLLYDLADAPRPRDDGRIEPRLLARWDILLLSHAIRARTRVLPERYRTRVITRNADVLPTFLVDGFVAGTWLPRRAADGTVSGALTPFGRLAREDRTALERELERLLPGLGRGAFGAYPGSPT